MLADQACSEAIVQTIPEAWLRLELKLRRPHGLNYSKYCSYATCILARKKTFSRLRHELELRVSTKEQRASLGPPRKCLIQADKWQS